MSQSCRRTIELPSFVVVCGILGLSLLGLSGCGDSADSSASVSSETETSSPHLQTDAARLRSTSAPPPLAAISSTADECGDDVVLPAPAKGTPEWLLREIAHIRTNLSATQPPTPLDEPSRAQHERIIELARQAIASTHDDPDREQLFNNAVHYLSDARLELAVSGDTEQSQLLVQDADSLYRRDRKSFAAVESAYKVVQLANRKAQEFGRESPDWLSEFANQARLFAERFPHEPNRCALALLTAGQLCDLHGMTDDAERCFVTVQTEFPDSIFAEQVNGFLRRLSLIGRPLELAGPTLEGGHVAIDQYQGRFVLVVFWASVSPQFQQDCDALAAHYEQFAPQGLSVIGVNLDHDELAIDRFLAKHTLPWPHIFYSEPDKRGGRHPAARYYGVQRVPTYWLIDRTGVVVATPDGLGELTDRVRELLDPS